MHLVFSPRQPRSFDECYELDYVGNIGFDPGTCFRERIRNEYEFVNSMGGPFWIVAEDIESVPPRLVGFACTVFVTDWAAEELLNAEEPYPVPKFLKWQAEGRCPFVTGAQIGRLNAGSGLNHLALKFSWDRTLHLDEAAAVRSSIMNRFVDHYAGNRIKQMLTEAYSEASYAECENSGFQVCNKYEAWWNAGNRAIHRPILYRLTNHEALRGPNYFIMRMLTYREPVFQFSPAQREVLQLARVGATDESISAALFLSIDAVKARWKSIYTRIESLRPGMFPMGNLRARGPEKRRTLVTYLENYPEELWPYGS